MNEPLNEEQINSILPLLPHIAKQVADGAAPDWIWLRGLTSQSSVSGDALLQELDLWAHILQQARAKVCSEVSAIELLQQRGIPEAPAVLAVNMASRLSSTRGQQATPYDGTLHDAYQQKLKTLLALAREADTALAAREYLKAARLKEDILRLRGELKSMIFSPTEGYHTWLADHEWHSDLDWERLPSFITGSDRLTDMLLQGKEVNSKEVSYRIVDRRLMRRLHHNRPVIRLEGPREKYHDWLPDHEWHDDLDWYHLPVWIKRNQHLMYDLLIHGKQVDGKYVSYKVVGSRLMRRLKDGVPVRRANKRSR
jgi:hypothetical protein